MLPPEIWQCILRYAITAPEFLDPDYWVDRFPPWVIVNRGKLDLGNYFKAEATRHSLRKVCRSWDEYLRKYAHRFVRMCDVVHGKVPIQYLRSAIRISFDKHPDWFCSDCKLGPYWLKQTEDFQKGNGYIGLCYRLISQYWQGLEAEILDYGLSGVYVHFIYDFFPPHMFPNLQCVPSRTDSTSMLFWSQVLDVVKSFPSLRHMYPNYKWSESTSMVLKSSILTTLVLSFDIPDRFSIPFTAQRGGKYDNPAWLPFIRIVGENLHSLSLPLEERCLQSRIPSEIWYLCPKLEDLCFLGQHTDKPPQKGHPLHSLRVSYDFLADIIHLRSLVWPSLCTLHMPEMDWEAWWRRDELPWTKSQLKLLGSVVLEDKKGEPYTKFFNPNSCKSDDDVSTMEPDGFL
ncbi:hypothetical protein CPB86DRAFT_778589 [Serendipita vermifera]|nr:hypothetical protein CPB86DRAFT_778589 [Serendipita vermifera]